jgi:dihydroorotate dehydrogenase (fumarate)
MVKMKLHSQKGTTVKGEIMKGIEVKFFDKVLENPFSNAAGVRCTTIDEMEKLNNSDAGFFVTKTATLEPRDGNEKPRFAFIGDDSINSMGLPNLGLDYYLNYLINLQTKETNKILFLSVSPIKPEDTKLIFEKIATSDYNGYVELNLSCPNVVGKPQIGYDEEATIKALEEAFGANKNHNKIGLKLPPYFDLVHFDKMAKIFNNYPISFVNCVNSLGNGFDIDAATGERKISPKDGIGGLGGDCILKTALSNVYNFRKRLNPEILIIGTGGIKDAESAIKHIRAGANLLQVGTALQKEDVEIFERLKNELIDFMKKHKIKTLDEIRGKTFAPSGKMKGREEI